MPNNNAEKPKIIPPYLPFATFRGFIETLKNTTIPSRIDNSVTPTMSGQSRGALNTCLIFLGLIDLERNVTPKLEPLVESYGDVPKWKPAIAKLITEAYAPLLNGLNISNATGAQVNEQFRIKGGVDGQVLEKAVRFYLSGLEEGGIEYSKLLQQRGATSVRKRGAAKRSKQKKPDDFTASYDLEFEEPAGSGAGAGASASGGLVPFVVPFPDKPAARFWLPKNITQDDWTMIDAIGRAYVQRTAKSV